MLPLWYKGINKYVAFRKLFILSGIYFCSTYVPAYKYLSYRNGFHFIINPRSKGARLWCTHSAPPSQETILAIDRSIESRSKRASDANIDAD